MAELDRERVAMVSKVFLEVLGRLPNRSALRTYAGGVMDAAELANALRESDERGLVVDRVTTALLGRTFKDTAREGRMATGSSPLEMMADVAGVPARRDRCTTMVEKIVGLTGDAAAGLGFELALGQDPYPQVATQLRKLRTELAAAEKPAPGPGVDLSIKVLPDGTLEGNNLVNGLLVGLGNYASASNRIDFGVAMEEVAEYGFNLWRSFSSLTRQGGGVPEPWWISPWDDTAEWKAHVRSGVEAAWQHGIRFLYCLYDESDRASKVGFAKDQNTFNGKEQNLSNASLLLPFYLDFIPPQHRNAVLVEDFNEPGDNGGRVGEWLRSFHAPIAAAVAARDYDNPLSIDGAQESPEFYAEPGDGVGFLWDHVWPKSQQSEGGIDVRENKAIVARLKGLRTKNPGVHIGLSTDGCWEYKVKAARDLAERVVGEGFSLEVMMAVMQPDRWTETQRRIIEQVALGAGLG